LRQFKHNEIRKARREKAKKRGKSGDRNKKGVRKEELYVQVQKILVTRYRDFDKSMR